MKFLGLMLLAFGLALRISHVADANAPLRHMAKVVKAVTHTIRHR